MGMNWQLLVVDDEPDVHAITAIALRRRRWQGSRFELTRARGCEHAKQLLTQPRERPFHLVLTDCVMEDQYSGFALGQFIRRDIGWSIPLILRTGIYSEKFVHSAHAGVFDAVLQKGGLTADGLLAAITTCLADAGRWSPSAPFITLPANRCVAPQYLEHRAV